MKRRALRVVALSAAFAALSIPLANAPAAHAVNCSNTDPNVAQETITTGSHAWATLEVHYHYQVCDGVRVSTHIGSLEVWWTVDATVYPGIKHTVTEAYAQVKDTALPTWDDSTNYACYDACTIHHTYTSLGINMNYGPDNQVGAVCLACNATGSGNAAVTLYFVNKNRIICEGTAYGC
jgi:hypothetical protein